MMADRNLVTYLEEQTSINGDKNLTGYKIEIDRSAAGQPRLLITITNALEEPTTISINDGLALFAPVLEWLLTDELIIDVAKNIGGEVSIWDVKSSLEALTKVARARMEADTTPDGSPVQRAPMYGGMDEDGL